MKLVIADDSLPMREIIKTKIEGFDQVKVVGEAINGLMAVEMVKELDPDLIILDIHMPVMGGIEVLKLVKKAQLRTKVCILTNYSYQPYRSKCLTLGADYFLSKTDDFEQLSVVIANVLSEN